jgi:DNA repair protein SbcC/Rad50
MRLERIRFKNLNSLTGEWEIDLTHPLFESEGLFAITGPTGAGKTTILDAICLALYGRTPRLPRVNKTENEIMSRHTGECFAELTLSTESGRYRCHWGQHRARKRPDGELQAPKHEMSDAGTGEILAETIRGVADRIEQVTGMDFAQFTRSVLLAQGGFQALLHANPDERAPILEQITGTELYSHVSIRVHERRASERQKLQILEAELAGFRLLSQEEEGALRTALEEANHADIELTADLQTAANRVARIERINQLKEAMDAIESEIRDWSKRDEAFAAARVHLERAHRALEMEGDYARLSGLRSTQSLEDQRRRELDLRIPILEETTKAAETALSGAERVLSVSRVQHEREMPKIKEARIIDVKRQAIGEAIALVSADREAKTQALEALHAEQASATAQSQATEQRLAQVVKTLEDTAADEGLIEGLGALLERFEGLRRRHREAEALAKALANAVESRDLAKRGWQAGRERLAERTRVWRALEETNATKVRAMQEILEGRPLAEWRADARALGEKSAILANGKRALTMLREAQAQLEQLSVRQAVLFTDLAKLETNLPVERGKLSALETECALNEEKVMLLKRIESLESARRQLREGEPCPLCGAEAHPFVEHGIPIPEDADIELKRIREKQRGQSEKVAGLELRKVGFEKDREQLAEKKADATKRLEEAETSRNHAYRSLQLGHNGLSLTDDLDQLAEANDRRLAHALEVVARAEAAEAEVTKARSSMESSHDEVRKAQGEADLAEHKATSAEADLVRSDLAAAHGRAETAQHLAALNRDLNAYDAVVGSTEEVHALASSLRERLKNRQALQREKELLEQGRGALAAEQGQRARRTDAVGQEITALGERVVTLGLQDEVLIRQRRDILGERLPDEEERRLEVALASAEASVDEARTRKSKAEGELGEMNAERNGLVKSLETRGGQLESLEEAFCASLVHRQFADEETFLGARLGEKERLQLSESARALDIQRMELDARRKDVEGRISVDMSEGHVDEDLNQLRQVWESTQARLRENQQSMGATRQKLEENRRLKAARGERIQAVEQVREACRRWDALHELIGSADGKKYRNFAQALSFEILLRQANQQLRKMTDRYILIRDKVQALEVNVIDTYQAGEVRSTKNLSGGESFLVSLSLALGLSHMTSRRVRVDSLFLDEGFGTLDEEALDTALSTLAGLQADGKLIGVISHVPALKERIRAQIQVIPKAGGRSELAGPGCRCM